MCWLCQARGVPHPESPPPAIGSEPIGHTDAARVARAGRIATDPRADDILRQPKAMTAGAVASHRR